MVRTVEILIATFLLTVTLTGQQLHQHPFIGDTEEIDGSTTPEKIPDLTAYRLFFLVAGAAPNATRDDLIHSRAHIHTIGLNDKDTKTVDEVLADFREKYADMIKRHNETATRLAGNQQIPDMELLILQRDTLVQSTLDKIKGSISADGANLLVAHIQRQKKGIKITRPKPQ
jgi:hypothetical protein